MTDGSVTPSHLATSSGVISVSVQRVAVRRQGLPEGLGSRRVAAGPTQRANSLHGLRWCARQVSSNRNAATPTGIDSSVRGGLRGYPKFEALLSARKPRSPRQNVSDQGAKRRGSSGYGEHLQRGAGAFWWDERAWRIRLQALSLRPAAPAAPPPRPPAACARRCPARSPRTGPAPVGRRRCPTSGRTQNTARIAPALP